jgi:transcriptional regulator with XRE-family HTH domain
MIRSAAKKMKQRSAGKPDIELGKRIRLRRVEQKISQAELGDKLGVSFQQVQKYEKGVNRVGAARLQQIATALDVPVTFFYDGDGKAREVESLLFLDSAFSLRLLRAYSKIKDQTVQRQLVSLMESIAANEARERRGRGYSTEPDRRTADCRARLLIESRQYQSVAVGMAALFFMGARTMGRALRETHHLRKPRLERDAN